MTTDELITLFDKTGSDLVAMFNEQEDLEKRFGKETQWVIKKKEKLQRMMEFYDACRDKMAWYEDMLSLMTVNYQALRILHYKNNADVNNEQLARLMGFEDIEKWKLLDSLDKRLADVEKNLS